MFLVAVFSSFVFLGDLARRPITSQPIFTVFGFRFISSAEVKQVS
jgi:hypothetical protein